MVINIIINTIIIIMIFTKCITFIVEPSFKVIWRCNLKKLIKNSTSCNSMSRDTQRSWVFPSQSGTSFQHKLILCPKIEGILCKLSTLHRLHFNRCLIWENWRGKEAWIVLRAELLLARSRSGSRYWVWPIYLGNNLLIPPNYDWRWRLRLSTNTYLDAHQCLDYH